jgi:sugar lactone lactonase YvrE
VEVVVLLDPPEGDRGDPVLRQEAGGIGAEQQDAGDRGPRRVAVLRHQLGVDEEVLPSLPVRGVGRRLPPPGAEVLVQPTQVEILERRAGHRPQFLTQRPPALQEPLELPADVTPPVSSLALTPKAPLDTPQTIALTATTTGDGGFMAEGIVTRGATAYAGSLANGAIVTADLLTGEVTDLVPSGPGPAVGLGLDAAGDLLFVSGGTGGDLRVYDAESGEVVETFDVDGGFVNDVTVTADAAYFTDSQQAVLYVLPIAEDGTLGDPSELPLTGDYMQVPDEFNANGIAASADGQTLIVAQSTDPDGTGSALYAVDADTGDATLIDVGGEGIENADGLVLAGTTLYVVENRSDDVAVVELADDFESGEIVDVLTDPDFNTSRPPARWRWARSTR